MLKNQIASFFLWLWPQIFYFNIFRKYTSIKYWNSHFFKVRVLITGKIKPYWPPVLCFCAIFIIRLSLRQSTHLLCRNAFFLIRGRDCQLTCNENYPCMISRPIWRTPRVLWKAADISDDYLNWIECLKCCHFKACETQSKEDKSNSHILPISVDVEETI